jgi:hypothetical protein
MNNFTYSKFCRIEQLADEIRASSITIALDYINGTQSETSIFFKASLSESEQTTLISIVESHTPQPVIEESIDVKVTETPPFSKPDYRTKRDATTDWVTCPSNQATTIDFLMLEERFATGGEMIFKNAKQGDYITAEVYDGHNGGIIPEPYRAALCENWPTVAKYVPKKWIIPTETDKYGSFEIDTYPLNAKISAGLILRVTYHASNISGDREVAMNYHLTKKL